MGIDLGTSSLKVTLIDTRGEPLGLASCEYNFDMPQPGWSEQDPAVWLAACRQAASQALERAGISPEQVEAVGLCGQMHGFVALDSRGAVVRPAILWPDQRSAAQVRRIYQEIGAEQLGAWTANPVATGFTLPSWLWVMEHEADTVRKTACLLQPKDYLRYILTGEASVEASDASATSLFDVAHCSWCEPLAQAFGIEPGILLPPHHACEIAGGLTADGAALLGLRPGVPVVYGANDQVATALALGIIHPGAVSCAISTGGTVVTAVESPVYDPALRTSTFCHAVPGLWEMQAATLSAGLCLKWLRDQLLPGVPYQQLADMAAGLPHAEGVFFLPHLVGERTPYMDPDSKAGFWGFGLRHTQAHLVRAVMEGVVFSLRECLDVMEGLGIPTRQVIAIGGGARHPLWLQLMADIFNLPIQRSEVQDGASMGAAMLAGIGAGFFPDMEGAYRAAARPAPAPVLPRAESAAHYAQAYQVYRQLYPAFKSLNRHQVVI
jgi:xylulokinase